VAAPVPVPVNTAPAVPSQKANPQPVQKSEPAAVKPASNGGNGIKPVEIKQPDKPAVVPASILSVNFSEVLLKVVSEKTGYPKEMLDVNMDMEADLGIDSIKRVEILGAVQQEMPNLPRPEPEALAEMRTLQHIIDYMGGGAATTAIAPAAIESAPEAKTMPDAASISASQGVSAEDLTATLLTVVSEKTGYPKEMLDLNMNMEADLGIDSIKRVEILGALQTQYPDLPKPEPEALAELATLSQIIAFMAKAPAQPAVASTAPAAPVLHETVSPVQGAPQPVPAPQLATSTDDLKAMLLQIVSEKTGYPQEMLDLEMDMEADLGIDSIKRVEILGALQNINPDLPKPEPETLAELRTLGHIIAFLEKPAEGVALQETPRPFV
jgi:acyl carrier protein